MSLTVATDGACSGNPGPAGWGWVDQHGNFASGALLLATNQVGELQGLAEALESHADVEHLTIEIDSAYALNAYSSWVDGWVRRGWVNSKGEAVKNRPLMERLLAAKRARKAAGLPPVTLVKVKGHARGKHPLNDAADLAATGASARSKRANALIRQGAAESDPAVTELLAPHTGVMTV